jgi:glucose-6-phosphate-specific signal transduction histidine kinase
MRRLNITLPDEIGQQIEAIPNKSRFIAEAIKERLERERRQKIDELLIEGYKATKEEDRRTNEEWEGITLEGWV